ncbi:MAG: OmpA family protein [Flavobacteriales bacterium]
MGKQLRCQVFSFLALLGMNHSIHAQGWITKPLEGVNTDHNEWVSGLLDGQLIWLTDVVERDYQYYRKHKRGHCRRLFAAQRGEDFTTWDDAHVWLEMRGYDVGSLTFDPVDSIVYFSSTVPVDGNTGKHMKIFKMHRESLGWSSPMMLEFCRDAYEYSDPTFDPVRRVMWLSSNRPGGYGQHDLWFAYLIQGSWGELYNPGLGVNSPYQELSPKISEGDIYYATDQMGGMGGFDLRLCREQDQWRSSITLAEPFNSASNDFSCIKLSEHKWILSSDRRQVGNADLFITEEVDESQEIQGLVASLDCPSLKNMPSIRVYNEEGELVANLRSNTKGDYVLDGLHWSTSYRMQLESELSPGISCVLSIRDAHGNVIRRLQFDERGMLYLELLPFLHSAMNLMHVEDSSILNVGFDGQLFTQSPGDIGRGVLVAIVDQLGVPIAVAYTNDQGKFRFSGLTPESTYRLKITEKSLAKNMIVFDRGESVVLPILNAEVAYLRVAPEESIELYNEFDEHITISTRDLFVINRLYYEFNSTSLTEESNTQIDHIAALMIKNPDLGIEISAHTDARGDDAYNKRLSLLRAQSVVHALTERGVETRRVVATGKGESEILNDCFNGVRCLELEHAINRRTELRLGRLNPQTGAMR